MASASTPLANEPSKDLTLVHTVQLKAMIKAERMVFSAGLIILRENPSEEVDDDDENDDDDDNDDEYYKSQETTFFSGHLKLTSSMKLRPEK